MGFITDSFYKYKLGKKNMAGEDFFIMIGIPLMLLYPVLWVKNMNSFITLRPIFYLNLFIQVS